MLRKFWILSGCVAKSFRETTGETRGRERRTIAIMRSKSESTLRHEANDTTFMGNGGSTFTRFWWARIQRQCRTIAQSQRPHGSTQSRSKASTKPRMGIFDMPYNLITHGSHWGRKVQELLEDVDKETSLQMNYENRRHPKNQNTTSDLCQYRKWNQENQWQNILTTLRGPSIG